jgi:2-keto-4-pentenoate hydratase/2-oxohepta-3-ene-1,7-dioic acid hydratase in catechol pathway
VFNDITVRDIQREEMKSGVFCLSKSIDTFVPIGPWIVTPTRSAIRAGCRWSCG